MTRSGDKSTPRSADAKGTGIYDSIETEQAAIGDASLVTGGPVGDAGETLILAEFPLSPTADLTTTSTSWTEVTTLAGVRFDLFELTNIDQLNIGLVAGTNGVGNVRLAERGPGTPLTNTEISGGSATTTVLAIEEDVSYAGDTAFDIEMKSDDGSTGRVYGRRTTPAVYILGVIS